jgi:hypothetical protein
LFSIRNQKTPCAGARFHGAGESHQDKDTKI